MVITRNFAIFDTLSGPSNQKYKDINKNNLNCDKLKFLKSIFFLEVQFKKKNDPKYELNMDN